MEREESLPIPFITPSLYRSISAKESTSPTPPRTTLTVALVQLCSTEDVQRNSARAVERIEQATRRGAQWVLLPENTCYIRREGEKIGWSQSLDGDVIESFCRLAQEFRVYLF